MTYKYKIKDIINENHVKWLYESQKIVDGIDKITDDVVSEINKNLKSFQIFPKLQLDNGEILNIRASYKLIQNILLQSDTLRDFVNIDLYIFYPKNEEEINLLTSKKLLDCRYNQAYDDLNHIYIGIEYYNGGINQGMLRKNLSHELTHIFQMRNNRKLSSQDDVDKYNERYNNIIDSTKNPENTPELYSFTMVSYWFTKSEISANINGLYNELYEVNVTKENYKELYKKTVFYDDYSYLLNQYRLLKNLNDKDWRIFMNTAKKFDFYKPTMTIRTTTDPQVFKKHFIAFLDRMVEYTNNSVNQCLYKLINRQQS